MTAIDGKSAAIILLVFACLYLTIYAIEQRRRYAEAKRALDDAELLLDHYRASDARLKDCVRQREQAIAGLLDRLNAATVANVAARRTLVLGMPRHRVDLRYINPN